MEKEDTFGINQYKNKVHAILAQSYFVYFLLFLISVFLDLIFKLKILNFSLMIPLGSVLIFLASLLILWAQRTSRVLTKETLTKDTFCKGPYCFTRSPTHWGLFILILGFGIIANAIFIIIFSIISFIITKLIFLRKEEEILEKKYGIPYLEYKKSVKL